MPVASALSQHQSCLYYAKLIESPGRHMQITLVMSVNRARALSVYYERINRTAKVEISRRGKINLATVRAIMQSWHVSFKCVCEASAAWPQFEPQFGMSIMRLSARRAPHGECVWGIACRSY
ncbi:uncharacterized protein LOC116804371 [Drosophila mojavensis]|uniref:uncharacterized protein LOC116804371 n=1 Tax=Drosophila mojavensis TaxID=7230 RepID=UPI0013EE4353|nr:uncharacterized protein LOC116804371 [Drosophila mojavensis]